MDTGFRFRAYPTDEQHQILCHWIGCQRFVYNSKVREDRYFRTFQRKSLTLAGQSAPLDQQYAQFIGDETQWLRKVPSQVLRNGAVRWMQSYSRFFKKLGGRPKIQKNIGAQSVWLTKELFDFREVKTTPEDITYRLFLGTNKYPFGELVFKAHRAFLPPKAITLTIEAGRWYLSFCNSDERALPSPQETADWLATFSENDLAARTVGTDRGVIIPTAVSDGRNFDFSPVQKARIEKKDAAIRRWQKKLARRSKGGANRRKAQHHVAALSRYAKDVRRDFAHQTSHALVADPQILLLVFEALGVQRMTRRPKAKQDEQGRWLKNNACAKAGLNRAILASAWGKTKEFSAYKAQRAGKLSLEVPAHHSSQECAVCGHTHPDNRPSQAEFVCQRCGNRDHADHNASKVIKKRGVLTILSGSYCEKDKKRTMRMAKKSNTVGEGLAEREGIRPRKSAETSVRRRSGNATVLGSEKQKAISVRTAEPPTSNGAAG